MLCCRHHAAVRSLHNHLELHPCESTGVEARADCVWHVMPLLIFVVAKAIIHGPLGPGQQASSPGSPASLFGLSPTPTGMHQVRTALPAPMGPALYVPSGLAYICIPWTWCIVPCRVGQFATSQSLVLPWHACMQHIKRNIMAGQRLPSDDS